MKGVKRTPPNKKKPETCEAKGCTKKPTTVLGGYWFCSEHGNRDYEKPALSGKSRTTGYVPLPQCATQDYEGKHCQEKPTRDAIAITTGRQIRLCEKCFKKWSDEEFIKAHNKRVTD